MKSRVPGGDATAEARHGFIVAKRIPATRVEGCMGAAANLMCGRDEELCTVILSRTAYSRWEVHVVSVKDPDIINSHRRDDLVMKRQCSRHSQRFLDISRCAWADDVTHEGV